MFGPLPRLLSTARWKTLVTPLPPSPPAPPANNRRKIPWRLSTPQKRRQRKRLRIIDNTISTIESSLAKAGYTSKPIVRWREEMPTEAEMVPKDKYTVFDRKEKTYRKSIRKVPKWTRVSQRINPPGF